MTEKSPAIPSKIKSTIERSPALIVLSIGSLLLAILVARGLNIGPLHTDIIIQRAWFHEVGVAGFPQRMFDSNQRHILYGSVYALMYAAFGENNLPYHLVYQLSRLLEGVFMAGLVYQLSRRRSLAICAGLALMLSVIRVRELYQEVNWFIEPTLALLLASSYIYVLSLRVARWRRLLFTLSIVLYLFSIFEYESGIPWIGVTLLIGVLARTDRPWRSRLWPAFRDALPGLILGGLYAALVIYGFKPPPGLTPDPQPFDPLRVVQQAATILTFPALLLDTLRLTVGDSYSGLIILFAAIAGAVAVLLMQRTPLSPALSPSVSGRESIQNSEPGSPSPVFWERGTGGEVNIYVSLALLAVAMVISSVIIGTTSKMGDEITDRITFGRSAGIMLLYVTLIFGLCALLRVRWKRTLAAALVALVLIGPGFAWLWIYQDYAHESRDEIGWMTAAVLQVHRLVYSPVYLVILTDPHWVLSRMNDASDVIVHEVQQNVWSAGGSATIDILKTGAYPETYANIPGTCDNIDKVASAGVCLDASGVHPSRWAMQALHPYADVVVVHYDDHAGTMTIIPGLRVADLPGYNFTTAGPQELRTDPARVTVPVSGVNAP
ncbi:MAG TPA: hypothetical protein VKQ72_08585 [Aggregatilineales bacterium]|nr:hypothetical protein [Aggregatilineales bacterium]